MQTTERSFQEAYPPAADEQRPGEFSFIDALVDPGGTFREPRDVAEHPRLRDEEKRTILLSWARNEFVIEAAGRSWPELKPRSRVEAVLDALTLFDPPAVDEYRSALEAIRGRARQRRFRHARGH